MMRLAVVLLAIFTCAAATAADEAARGRAIAAANCSRCHAIGKTGKSPNPASPPFRTLAGKYPLENLEEALAEGIVVGHGGLEMPRFQFSPEQIDALLTYITSIQSK
ncbi:MULTISPECIES: c-type cytochrome [Methylosinus]|uniref:Cytochrome C n=1 Tax=Methylosinus trichosporium (strain ATCC 35070 / NCIMB 11131 / UNIQEM 75 / OB3b) TaxID=595536 RepID=A0A2D2D000_METT3|nr:MULTISPECIES: cytochrome c [Methylosinus]ATQ68343.1 cytochrome C [Methylosinus trichosporium OB3b]OBS50919.1 cytochrome C [Methylosinus sp. 3S-1]